jgi:hypothetical protein
MVRISHGMNKLLLVSAKGEHPITRNEAYKPNIAPLAENTTHLHAGLFVACHHFLQVVHIVHHSLSLKLVHIGGNVAWH